MIPVIEKLNSKLAKTTDPIERAELSLDRATYLARIGDFEGSSEVVNVLRQHFGHNASVRLSIRYMVCEGLIAHFRADWANGRDRFMRAHALAVACGLRDLAALAGSWLAHVDFNRRDYESTRRRLSECLSQTGDELAAARLRAMILMGDASTYCGEMGEAKKWYRAALTLAVREGDQVSIEAVMYNRTAFRLARVRTLRALGEPDDGSGAFTSMEVSSAVSYYYALGYASLDSLIVALRARCNLQNAKYELAAADLEFLVQQGLATSYQSDLALLKAELALCRLHLGIPGMDVAFLDIQAGDFDQMDPDDKLVFCHIMLTIGRHLGASAETMNRLDAGLQASRIQYAEELEQVRSIVKLSAVTS